MIRGSGVRRPPPFVLAVIPTPREPRRPPPPPPPAAPRAPTTRAVPALWRLKPEAAFDMA
jgi:hypothetical protein